MLIIDSPKEIKMVYIGVSSKQNHPFKRNQQEFKQLLKLWAKSSRKREQYFLLQKNASYLHDCSPKHEASNCSIFCFREDSTGVLPLTNLDKRPVIPGPGSSINSFKPPQK